MDYQQFVDSVNPEDIAKADYYRKVLGTDGYSFPEQGTPLATKNNQLAMRQWAAPVKQQNKQAKNNYMIDSSVSMTGGQGELPGERYPSMSRKGHLQDGRGYNDYVQRDINRNSKVGNINRLAGPIGALPMVALEALGMIGAAQEAQRQGVNPMINWLQRMVPTPIVAPTGNGGEVYNYQSGQRYTPEY